MLTLGPHLSQVPNASIVSDLKRWQPPVCLVLMDILPDNLKKLSKFRKFESDQKDYLDDNYPAGSGKVKPDLDEYVDEQIVAKINKHNNPGEVGSTGIPVPYYIRPIANEASLKDMKLIGRIFIEDADVKTDIFNEPEETARLHHRLVKAVKRILRHQGVDRVNYWVIVNEVLADNPEQQDKLARYEKERMALVKAEAEEAEAARAAGKQVLDQRYGCGLFAFSTGKPDLIGQAGGDYDKFTAFDAVPHGDDITTANPPQLARWQRPKMHEALNAANTWNGNEDNPPHVVLLHQYFKPDGGTTWVNTDYTLTEHNYQKQVGRFENHVFGWFQRTYRHLKVIMSEYGADGRIHYEGEEDLEDVEGGWKYYDNEETKGYDWTADNAAGENRYVAALKALDAHNRQPDPHNRKYTDVIEGYCLFCLGNENPAPLHEFWSYQLDRGRHADGIVYQVLPDLIAYSESLAPQSVTARVAGSDVTLSWTAPTVPNENGDADRSYRGPPRVSDLAGDESAKYAAGVSGRQSVNLHGSDAGPAGYVVLLWGVNAVARTSMECRPSDPKDVVTGARVR